MAPRAADRSFADEKLIVAGSPDRQQGCGGRDSGEGAARLWRGDAVVPCADASDAPEAEYLIGVNQEKDRLLRLFFVDGFARS